MSQRISISVCGRSRLSCPFSVVSSPVKQGFQPHLPSRARLSTICRPVIRRKTRQYINSPTNRRNAAFVPAAKNVFRENPFSTSLAGLLIACGIGSLFYTNYIYKTYVVDSYNAFPEPVAQKLRRALYYTNQDLQPKNALKYYRQAIETADELGMDPFSDEMLGVKIQVAAMFEKAGAWQQAINTLELVRSNCLEWMEKLGEKEDQAGRRTKILAKAVGISVRLGEYYANDKVKDFASAEERLVWAVTTALKEKQRRETEGIKEGEGPWLEDEEMGGALEALGDRYSAQQQHHLSAPLYLQSLSICPPRSCHAVTLMTNLATALALQSPSSSSANINPLTAATTWATRALDLARSIAPPDRTTECDDGCAVATINLGDFARMAGRTEDAKRLWIEGRQLCKALGMDDGVSRADEALRSIE